MAEPEEFQYGFQQLEQHNAGLHYDQDHYAASGHNSTYGTPEPSHLLAHGYGRSYDTLYGDHYEETTGAPNDGYGTPMHYPNPTDGYYASPGAHSTPYPGYHISSPPTPAASDRSSNGKRKREPRSLGHNGSPARTSYSPKPKRNKQAKGDKAKIPKLDAPLSILTKDYTNVEVKDMCAWVNRTAEERQKEVEKRKGKITRPMNSFMLYRSAFADRTKTWCTQNNHQVVSSVSGESWPMEPKEIRDLYTEYARIERDNHQKAHPGYKFSPTKAGAAGRKKRDETEEREDRSDLDELDLEWRPHRSKTLRTNGVARNPLDRTWGVGNGAYVSPERGLPTDALGHQSTYHFNNPGKPLPVPLMNEDLHRHYYQQSVRPNMSYPYTEDVFVRREDYPGISHGAGTPLIGLPGGHHHELLDDNSMANTPLPPTEPQVDPYLLARGDHDFEGLPGSSGNEHELRDFDNPEFFNAENGQPKYDDDPTLTNELDPWQYGGGTSPGTAAASFDNWFETSNG